MVDFTKIPLYNYVKNNCKGGKFMRKYYIDNIRQTTVVLVVIYHVIYMFNGILTAGVAGPFHEVQIQDAVQYLLYPWFMVLLFIVSGISARYSLAKHAPREFMRERTRKLLVPSTVGLPAFHWIQGYINMRLSGAFETITENAPKPALYFIMCVSGTGVLWFIQMLWIFSMLLLPVRKLEKGKLSAFCEKFSYSPLVLAILGIAVWGSAQFFNTPVIAVYRFGIYGFAFFLGYYIFSQEKVTDTLSEYGLFFGGAAIVLAIVYTTVCFGKNYAVSPVVNSPLSVAFLWTACLAILGLMKRYGNRTSPFADYMNRKSWGLYIFHYLPISVCGLLFQKNSSLPPVCIYLLTGAAGFAGALLLYEILSRIPILRWCVLGIRKSKVKT